MTEPEKPRKPAVRAADLRARAVDTLLENGYTNQEIRIILKVSRSFIARARHRAKRLGQS